MKSLSTKKVAFSGKMCSGKTTMAEYLVSEYDFTRIAIGDQIKRVSNMVIEDLGALKEYLNEMMPEYAKEINEEFLEFWDRVENLQYTKQGNIYLKNEAYRGMTQKTGDIIRGKYGSDVWIHLVKKEADKVLAAGGKIVCDDVRLQAEKTIFEEDNYTVFRLEIEKEEQKKRIIQMYDTFDPKALEHKTETDLDNAYFAEDLRINTSEYTQKECFEQIKKRLK